MNRQKVFSTKSILLTGAILCMSAFTINPSKADASEVKKPISGAAIQVDYEEQILSIKPDKDVAKIYFAKSTKDDETYLNKIKVWDDVKVKDNGKAVIDISTFIGSRDYYLAIKIGKSDTVNGSVKINKEPKLKLAKDFDITTYNIKLEKSSKNDTTPILSGSGIEYKKGKKGNWNDWNDLTLQEKKDNVASWQKMGTTLYARTTAYNAPEDSEEGIPASNEVTVKIRKLSNGPKLTIDGSKLVAKMRKGTEYRINYTGNADDNDELDTSGKEIWTKISDVEAKTGINLSTLATKGNVVTTSSAALKGNITIEYRTAKKISSSGKVTPASKITTVELKAQSDAPTLNIGSVTELIAEAKDFGTRTPATGVSIKVGTSKNDIDGNKRQYEYVVLKGGNMPSEGMLKLSWKSIKEGSEIKVKKGSSTSQVTTGDKILFRAKTVKESTRTGNETTFQLASEYAEYAVPKLD